MKIFVENGDAAVENALRRVGRAVLDAGAHLAPELAARYAGSELSLVSDAPPGARKPLVWLPDAALLPLDEVELDLEGDDLVIKSHKPTLTAARRAIWDAKLALYNLTGKIRQHKLTAPRVAFIEEPEILGRLANRRMSAQAAARSLYSPDWGSRERYTIGSFFASRTLPYKPPGQSKTRESVMPVIEFLNHHAQGAGYLTTPSGRIRATGLLMPTARPVAGSQECFARYWYYDAHDTLLGYGFVDESAPVVRSVITEIDLDRIGSVRIRGDGISGIENRSLQSDMADLSLMIPQAERVGEDAISVSHLFIPAGGSRRLLRQVLIGVVNALRSGLSEADQHRLMLRAEERILAENIRHYEELAGWLAGASVAPELQSLLDIARTLPGVQRSKLEKYMALPE